MLYLIMLMSDIDFSRIGAKVSDKGPPSRWQARGPSLFGWTMETMRNATKTRSEFEQADGIRGSETPERMAALREAQPFVDQGVTRSSSSGTNGRTPNSLAIAS